LKRELFSFALASSFLFLSLFSLSPSDLMKTEGRIRKKKRKKEEEKEEEKEEGRRRKKRFRLTPLAHASGPLKTK